MSEKPLFGFETPSFSGSGKEPVHSRLLSVPVSEEEEERRAKLPKTVGERAYFWFQFIFVKGLILGATAFIGYHAKFGSETGALGFIRKFQQWCIRWIEKPIAGAGERAGEKLAKSIGGERGRWLGAKTHEVIAVFGGAFASTMVIFHGGNVVAPVVQYFENHRRQFINGVNRRWGKPGDEALGNEKFEFLPHQTAGDVVKGRLTAWLTVFGSFFTAFLLIGKVKGSGTYRLDAFEDWSARVVSGLGKGSKFGHIPVTQDLARLAAEKPDMFAGAERNLLWYKTSRILALDFYATTMSILVWNFAARLSARSRRHGEPFLEALGHELTGKKHHTAPTPAPEPETPADPLPAPKEKEEATAAKVDPVPEKKAGVAAGGKMQIAAEAEGDAAIEKRIEAAADEKIDGEAAAQAPVPKQDTHAKHDKAAKPEKPGSVIHHAVAAGQQREAPHAAQAQ